MLITEELRNLLQNLGTVLNNLNYYNTHIDDIKFKRFLHTLEKNRFEIYEQVKFLIFSTSSNFITCSSSFEMILSLAILFARFT